MRKVCLLLCLLLLAGTAVASSEDPPAKKSKASKSSVDCSTADDARLSADVKDKLAKTASLKDFAINTSATGGVVTLTGKVKTGANKGTATRVAKSVKCVKSVENKIEVEVHGPIIKTNKNSGSGNKSSRSKKTANQ